MRLNLALTLDADAQRVLTGTTMLRRQAEGLGFTANLEGPISRLIAPQFRDFFGPNTKLTATGATSDAGGFELESLDLDQQRADAEGRCRDHGRRLPVAAGARRQIADASAQKVLLPVPGGETMRRPRRASSCRSARGRARTGPASWILPA